MEKKNKPKKEIEMLIGKKEFFESVLRRLPMLEYKTAYLYLNNLIKLISDRLCDKIPIIVDSFGTLYRTQSGPNRVVNIVTGKPNMIISYSAKLNPHEDFKKYFKDPENKKIIVNNIIKKSKQAMSVVKNKRFKNLI